MMTKENGLLVSKALLIVMVVQKNMTNDLTHTRWRLMEGLDDIGITLRNEDAIAAYESHRPSFKPAVHAQ